MEIVRDLEKGKYLRVTAKNPLLTLGLLLCIDDISLGLHPNSYNIKSEIINGLVTVKEKNDQILYEVSAPGIRMFVKFDLEKGKLHIILEGQREEEIEKILKKRLDVTVMSLNYLSRRLVESEVNK